MKINWSLIKTIAIIILIIIILGIFLIPKYTQAVYNKGIEDGILQIAQSQTETGYIVIVHNDSLQSVLISQICGGGGLQKNL